MLKQVLNVVRAINQHELARRGRISALGRYFRLQIATRLTQAKVLFPFVDDTRLFGKAGMTGANANYYCGILEFRDMAFLLHYLRPRELFIDVGANVGSYSVLASGAIRARSIAFEPVTSTSTHFQDNIHVNRIESLVELRCICIGDRRGVVHVTQSYDTTNHIVPHGVQDHDSVETPISTLDLEIDASPVLVKIDTEGFDADVISGARRVISGSGPMALIVEFAPSRSNRPNSEAIDTLRSNGFIHVDYEPLSRRLTRIENGSHLSNNFIFVRDWDDALERIRSAPRRHIGTWAVL
jgi:FkbM family methyltransferase